MQKIINHTTCRHVAISSLFFFAVNFTNRRILIFIGIILLTSCSGTKFLTEKESFYTGSKVVIHPIGKVPRQKSVRKDLEAMITPKPNTTILGSRPGVWFYFIAGNPTKKKGFRSFIKNKIGQKPVLISDVHPHRMARTLNGQLNNEGYFQSDVKAEVKTKNKKSKVIYDVDLPRPYHLDTINYPQPRDSIFKVIVRDLRENSVLHVGDQYNLDKLKQEQARIEMEVENYGLFYFDDRYLLFKADSTVGNKKVALELTLEPGIPQRAKRIYKMGRMNVFPDHSLSADSSKARVDTVRINGFNYIDSQHLFRPDVVTNVINLKPGETYSRRAHDITLTHLMGLGTFKYANLKFYPSREDSFLLDTDIFLTPFLKKSIRLDLQAVSKSNNFVGPHMALTFTNRNALRGAERLEFKFTVGYEVQIGRQQANALNALELGAEASVEVPRFISPIRINFSSKRYLPQTKVRGGFNVQNRIGYYRINSFNLGYSYTWRETTAKTHQLFPIDISYFKLGDKSEAFNTRLEENKALASSLTNQFIFGTHYTYTLNTQLKEPTYGKIVEAKKYNFYFNADVEFAGHTLEFFQGIIDKNGERPYSLFGSPYSEYARVDLDFRYYLQFDKHNKLASRIEVGYGYAHGNSSSLPYIKQFAIGGANSVRAFPARSLGPGTYNVRTDTLFQQSNTFFIDQRADMKLEGNVEYRFDIYKIVKGGLFVDAGNIWMREDDGRTGSEFKSNQVLKELAVGTGFGLRFDFSFFVLRFDLAFPLRKPYLPEANRWVIRDIDFGSAAWRNNNLLLNIAIGYPF